MKRRSPDWRMRPISVDGRDNTTRLERGPQGTGGDGAAGGFARSGGLPIGGWHRRRAEQTRYLIGGMAGSALTSTMLRKAPYRTVRCLMLRAGLWENPMSGISGGAAGNVYYGGTANPPATERAGPDKPPPTVARASALPDDRSARRGWSRSSGDEARRPGLRWLPGDRGERCPPGKRRRGRIWGS